MPAPVSQEILDKAASLRAADIPDILISKQLGISRSVIHRRLGPSGNRDRFLRQRNADSRIHFLDKDGNPPKCPRCDCCSMVMNSQGYLKWCGRCITAHVRHGFYGHVQYDRYLTNGCWIDGCSETPTGIDHDHKTGCHPRGGTSCDNCRRGPICYSHNMVLTENRDSSALRFKADEYHRRSEMLITVADSLRKWEQRDQWVEQVIQETPPLGNGNGYKLKRT